MNNPAVENLSRLPDIDEVISFGPDDEACFDEIRAVLEKHHALHRFGIILLHQHFDIADNEVLVENIDRENRILTSRPAKVESTRSAVEASWRLDSKKKQKECESKCNKWKNDEGEETQLSQHYTVS